MTTGKFKADASLRNTSTSSWNQVFSGSQRLTSASAILTDNNGNVERYIFPTRENSETFTTTSTDAKNNSLGIQISLSNGNSFTYWTKEIAMNASNQPLKSGDDYLYKPFQFDPNYQYDVLLTVTSKALVVTILPRYYGWIDNNETQSNTTALTEIGNPVTFGGVVWADRNLGATSADPTKSEMDWERARGWYYQFGRSIPYYIKGSMQDPNHIDDKELVSFINGSSYNTTSNNVPMCEAANHASNSRPYPYVINHYGEGPIMFSDGKAYDASYSDPKNHLLSLNSEYDASSKLAKMPDESSLKFNFTYQLGEPVDYDFNHGTSAVFWNTDSNLPCPKGWRLPTYNEFLTIYPSVEKVGNIAFNSSYQSTVTSEKFKTSGTDTYYEITLSKSANDAEDAQYLGIKKSTEETGVIYAIKNQGTDKAYRIRWRVQEVGTTACCANVENNSGSGTHNQLRTVLVIERFPATSATTLKYNNLNASDWSHPSETLYLPVSGYIHRQDNAGPVSLIYAGCEGIYWTRESASGNLAKSIRMKVSGNSGSKALWAWSSERRGYGCQIRCVRDDSVVDK